MLEVLSESGYVQSWRGIVDPDGLLGAEGRGTRTATHAAWAQLGIGAVGGIAAMLILYGVGRNAAVAAVLLYEAVGLVVPLLGGGIAYLLLRRKFGPIESVRDAPHPAPSSKGGMQHQRQQAWLPAIGWL